MSLVTPEVDELVVPSLILFDPDAFTVNLAAILLGSLSMRIKCWPAVEAAGSVTVAWSVMKYTVEVPLIVAPLWRGLPTAPEPEPPVLPPTP